MEWTKNGLLNERRFRDSSEKKSEYDGRNSFENDGMRVITSASFRRLQDKAQVFPLDNSDFVRTRLTHSLEVGAIAESIGASIENELIKDEKLDESYRGCIKAILHTVGLIHDIGNPPFGHFGETAIRNFFNDWFSSKAYEKISQKYKLTWSQKYDFMKFEGNAQTLRDVTKLNYLIEDELGNNRGMNLTYATLSVMMKYTGESYIKNKSEKKALKKVGYFQSEKNVIKEIADKTQLKVYDDHYCRHPLAFLVEASDDIAYSSADLEDGFKKGVISLNDIKDELENVKENDKYKLNGNQKKKIECVIKKCDEYAKEVNKQYSNADEIVIERLKIYVRSIMITSVIETFRDKYNSIMEGTYDNEILMDSKAKGIRIAFKNLALKIFNNKVIIERELTGEKIISKLLEIFVDALTRDILKNDMDDKAKRKCEVNGKMLEFLNNDKSKRIYYLISDNYRFLFENCKSVDDCGNEEHQNNELYQRLLLITDFICGMTDNYSLDIYQRLVGIKI